MTGPVKPNVLDSRHQRVRKMRSEKSDPKRSEQAKRETQHRRRIRDQKRGGSVRHGDLGRGES